MRWSTQAVTCLQLSWQVALLVYCNIAPLHYTLLLHDCTQFSSFARLSIDEVLWADRFDQGQHEIWEQMWIKYTCRWPLPSKAGNVASLISLLILVLISVMLMAMIMTIVKITRMMLMTMTKMITIKMLMVTLMLTMKRGKISATLRLSSPVLCGDLRWWCLANE